MPFPDMFVKPAIAPPNSAECVADVRRWMSTCESSHGCLQKTPHPLPKRVIDVGSLTSPVVRMIETSGELERYACLSHCWGNSRPACITTVETLERNKRCIGWDLLPATFRDAIDFTRRLGLRFIWIDSICIIQNSPEDWQEQSALMASIYGGAYVTICATSASSDDGGCYLPSAPDPYRRGLTVQGFNSKEYTVWVETHLKERHIPYWSEANFEPNPQKFPLMTRGWTFQERLLSARLIHFTAGEVMWECCEQSSCQCPTNDMAQKVNAIDDDSLFLNSLWIKKRHVQATTNDPHPSNSEDNWRYIATLYSALRLTFSKDKLPGLSGTATQMQSLRPDDRYLGGIWRSNALVDMQWVRETTSPHSRTKRPDKWRCPSWSWAAIDGNISYPFLTVRLDLFCTIVDASVTLAGSDSTGELTSGHIILTGPLVVATLTKMSESGEGAIESNKIETKFIVDCEDDFQEGTPGKLWIGDNLACLRLAGEIDPPYDLRSFPGDFSLVLRFRIEGVDGGPPTYERVGSIQAHPAEKLDEYWYNKDLQPTTIRLL